MTRVVLLNGPKGAGKDAIADAFIDREYSSRKLPVAWPVKLSAAAEYAVPSQMVAGFETMKDTAQTVFEGKTPRQVYIEYGNRVRKERGDEFFAEKWRAVARTLRGYRYLIVPDVRLQVEVDVAVKEFGATQVLLCRVHRDNKGWKDDLGGYCTAFNEVDLFNNGMLDHASAQLRSHVEARLF